MIEQDQQTITHSISPALLPAPAQEVLFFAIETTGLSFEHSFLYLIGCIYYKENNWQLLQFFSDHPEKEADLLRSFFSFASNYHYLIHYNGDHFALPFLKKRAAKQNIPVSLPSESIDLYKELRPFQSLLNLTTMKQKNLENYLHFSRKDTHTSKEQIKQYKIYLNTKEHNLLSSLLLHNKETLKGLLFILSLRTLPLLKKGQFHIQKTICQSFSLLTGEQTLFVTRLLPFSPLLVPIYYQNEFCTITTQMDHSIQIKIPVFTGTLKYFYSNYKDYYYLPEEDYAIHKSVASYVDTSHRIKAKKSTCYTKKNSHFLIQPTPLYTPKFKQNYNDIYSYFELTEEFLNSLTKQKDYFTILLSQFL